VAGQYHRAVAGSFTPRLLRDAATAQHEPLAVVETFLAALAAGDMSTAAGLLDEHVTYINVGMPTIRGRRATVNLLTPLSRPGARFEVYLHGAAANGTTVLTDRTDVLEFGRLRLQFWVAGRFDVEDGRITLWRDSFDYVDVLRSVARGLIGVVVPALRPAPPRAAQDQPGRH
jgi:limonene-1,2-epoxide hydrolase